MTRQRAEEILRQADYWQYAFDLPWGKTKPAKGDHEKRQILRKRHFFDPLVKLYGGSLAGTNVLDLGCCQGFWSFEASRAGAGSCIGVDSSENFINEAQALAVIFGITNCDFSCRQLEDDRWWNELHTADITLFLGIFYHLADPLFVLRKAAALTRETIIVDTEVSARSGSLLEIFPRDPLEPTTCRSHLQTGIRIAPTKQAVRDLLADLGFAQVRYVEPGPEMPADYVSGRRVTFIATRKRDRLITRVLRALRPRRFGGRRTRREKPDALRM